ncbi:MAG: hypothetical protein L0Y66_14450 [Myxococcaceae bacterium]|nr:hypothetical protein [Myxococcaceae bacterium]MCI0673661.1 hypothetical protein [Myxococcaceae bacterium]
MRPCSLSPRLLLALLLTVPAVACDSSRTGDPCLTSLDCLPPQTCYVRPIADAGFPAEATFPSGFCSRACDAEGAGGGCSGGSVCALSGGVLICAPTCQADTDCREGYTCQPVGGDRACVFRPP